MIIIDLIREDFMEEKIFFEKRDVLVTDKRVVVGTNTAPIVNIHSVSMGKRKYLLGIILSLVAAPVLCMWSFALLVSRPNPPFAYIGLIILAGVFFFGVLGC